LKRDGIRYFTRNFYTATGAGTQPVRANWVAPYVNRLDNISSHGIEVVGDIAKNFRDYNIPCKVLAASFKTVDQVHRVSMTGAHASLLLGLKSLSDYAAIQ